MFKLLPHLISIITEFHSQFQHHNKTAYLEDRNCVASALLADSLVKTGLGKADQTVDTERMHQGLDC